MRASTYAVRPEVERFEAKVDRSGGPDACHPWTGARDGEGYGSFRRGRAAEFRVVPAHRFAFGPIPDGVPLDHTCHNADPSCPGGKACAHRRCCNRRHLEPVTAAINNTRARGRLRGTSADECVHGHPFDDRNTYRHPKTGHRVCRACRARRARVRRTMDRSER